MREEFEYASSSLVEVDFCRRLGRSAGLNADVLSIDLKSGRGSSGVDLRWHAREELQKVSKHQKDEL